MKVHVTDVVRLDENGVCSIEQLAEVSGLSLPEVRDLIDSGVIAPVPTAEPASFHLQCIVTVKAARRLRDDFELDQHGLALAMRLLQRIERLEAALRATRGSK